eukprot:436521-Rhodomonas_salina.6
MAYCVCRHEAGGAFVGARRRIRQHPREDRPVPRMPPPTRVWLVLDSCEMRQPPSNACAIRVGLLCSYVLLPLRDVRY